MSNRGTIDFFGRYRRILRVTYVVVVLISVALFIIYISAEYRNTERLITDRFRQTAAQVDYFLKSTTDHVNAMRLFAERYWMEHPEATNLTGLAAQLCDAPARGVFHLDNVRPPYVTSNIANLTGLGTIHGRAPQFYREIATALALNPLFVITRANVPNAAWSYFVGTEYFINIAPWTHSTNYCYSRITCTQEFITLGMPTNNPGRIRFWTGIYVDECGLGLMVTCGAPVYDGTTFVGTVCADATLDALNRILSDFPYANITLCIVSERDQALAHPRLIRSTDTTIKRMADILPSRMCALTNVIMRAEAGVLHYNYSVLYARAALSHAPWQLLLYANSWSIFWPIFLEALLILGVLLGGLTAMLMITNRLTRREFIRPAELLVAHIEQASHAPETPAPAVPAAWTPWFATVSKVFLEHKQLLGELREHNEHLDALVAQRTQELSQRNQEVEDALKKLKEMQQQIVMQEKMASLGGLTAGVAHEIKNPLNFVNNFAELSTELFGELRALLVANAATIDAPAQSEINALLDDIEMNIRKINEHGKRADSIVRGMLLLSRGKTGERMPVDINALVAEYLNLGYHGLRALDATFNVKLESNYDPAVGTLPAVPQDLSRAILNLVNNACYAAFSARSKRGAGFMPTVAVRTVATADYIDIGVRDNGMGISPALREKIFAPFFTTKPAGKGTGLGLSITFDIVVHEHHGEILLDSVEGEYAEFTIRLPRAQTPPGAPA
ncbi:MAG: ATP-binding protein [bacterium]|nr:ATP-binding protein [bacterium]